MKIKKKSNFNSKTMSSLQAIIISVLVQFILPIHGLFETSKFVKKGKYDSLKFNLTGFHLRIISNLDALTFTIIESYFQRCALTSS